MRADKEARNKVLRHPLGRRLNCPDLVCLHKHKGRNFNCSPIDEKNTGYIMASLNIYIILPGAVQSHVVRA